MFAFFAVAAFAAAAQAGNLGLGHGGYGLGLAHGGYGLGLVHGGLGLNHGLVNAAPAVAVHSVPSVGLGVGVAHQPVVSTSVSYQPAVVSKPVLAKVATSAVTTRSDTYTPLVAKALAVAQPAVTVAHAAPVLSHVQAAPVLSHVHAAPVVSQVHAAPVLSHVQAAPVLSHVHAAPVLSHVQTAPVVSHVHAAPLAYSAGKW